MGKWSHLNAENDCQTAVWLLEELTRRQNKSKISYSIVLRREMTKHLSRSEIQLPKNSSDKYIIEKSSAHEVSCHNKPYTEGN